MVRLSWQNLPVDGVGYLNSQDFLGLSDDKVREFVQRFEECRYKGERNWNNLWRSTLGLDSTHGKTVLDYGCGFGIEALQFCKAGNSVCLFDIFESNIKAAEKVLRTCGYQPVQTDKIDVFYSNGVLHHTPEIREILKLAVSRLNDGGEIRLLLYSDKIWQLMTHTPLPAIEKEIQECQGFETFVTGMDGAGEYADWYNREKLEYRLGDFLRIKDLNYIMPDGRFITVTLCPK